MIRNDDHPPIMHLLRQMQKIIQRSSRCVFAHKININVVNIIASMAVMSGVLLYAGFTPVQTEANNAVALISDQEKEYRSCIFAKSVGAGTQQLQAMRDEECLDESQGITPENLREQHLAIVLEGHPMAGMAPALSEIDEDVAAFIVGIGKIESNWGKQSPWKDGQDCYNYWGYKTSGSRGKALGHACFGSPEEAVATIAKRLDYFVNERGKDTPQKLLVWKCGSSCASHSPEGVAQWVNVVSTYSQKALPTTDAVAEIQRLSRR